MYQISTFGVVLAGASVFSLASAQSSSQSADFGSLFTGSVGVFVGAASETLSSFTVHNRHSTASPAASTPTDEAVTPESHSGDPSEEEGEMACYPGWTGKKKPDWTAPCAAVQAIQAQCSWGPDALEWVQNQVQSRMEGEEPEFLPDTWEQQPPELVRACYCSSQYAEMVLGCGACLEGHGIDPEAGSGMTSNTTAMRKWSELFCDVDASPTQEDMSEAFEIALGHDPAVVPMSVTSTASNTLGNATDVSLYFTPSVSSAYVVAMATATSNGNHSNAWFTYTSLSTSDGQIVPTAIAEKGTGGDGADGSQGSADATESGSGTATAAAGAMQTAMAYSGFGAGALGFAMLAFAL